MDLMVAEMMVGLVLMDDLLLHGIGLPKLKRKIIILFFF